MSNSYYVYILSSHYNTTLYTGVTNDLERRLHEHLVERSSSFSRKYNLEKLVYVEVFDRIEDAIAREKQIKAGSRAKKVALIMCKNPGWIDLRVLSRSR